MYQNPSNSENFVQTGLDIKMSLDEERKPTIDVDLENENENENERIVVDEEVPEAAPKRARPQELPTKTRLKITVKKLHVTAEWKWIEGGEDTCGICRMEFEAACTLCKFPGDDCPLVQGTCRHSFHEHCIDKWTEAPTSASRAQCPLCRQDWHLVPRNENPEATPGDIADGDAGEDDN